MIIHYMKLKILNNRLLYFLTFNIVICLSCKKEYIENEIFNISDDSVSFKIDLSNKNNSLVLIVNNRNDSLLVLYFSRDKLEKGLSINCDGETIKTFKKVVVKKLDISQLKNNEHTSKSKSLRKNNYIKFSFHYNYTDISSKDCSDYQKESPDFDMLMIKLRKKCSVIYNYYNNIK